MAVIATHTHTVAWTGAELRKNAPEHALMFANGMNLGSTGDKYNSDEARRIFGAQEKNSCTLRVVNIYLHQQMRDSALSINLSTIRVGQAGSGMRAVHDDIPIKSSAVFVLHVFCAERRTMT